MPSWEAYREAARARGSLAFELYVVLTIPVATQEELKACLPEHLDYQRQLENEGSLAFAGPLSDESGTEMHGMGLIIYRAGSFEQARDLADNDPMHERGVRTYTLRKWMVNEGQVSLTARLSAQSVALR